MGCHTHCDEYECIQNELGVSSPSKRQLIEGRAPFDNCGKELEIFSSETTEEYLGELYDEVQSLKNLVKKLFVRIRDLEDRQTP